MKDCTTARPEGLSAAPEPSTQVRFGSLRNLKLTAATKSPLSPATPKAHRQPHSWATQPLTRNPKKIPMWGPRENIAIAVLRRLTGYISDIIECDGGLVPP